jgi:hypothetical protein
MVFSVRAGSLLCLGLAFASSLALAQAVGSPPRAASPLLPPSFGPWMASTPAQTGTDAAAVDAANASVLKEYGLKDFASDDYRHGAGKLTIKAMRFVDATGAYGAFTFYRKADMHPAEVGKEGAIDGSDAVFWTGTTVVDATADHFGPEERSALKALAAALPQNVGSESIPPSLPRYLPEKNLERSTVHYAIGPDAYAKTGGVLPPELIDFSRDAEVITAQYPERAGQGILTILEYPTPQMAAERAKAIGAALKGASLPTGLQHESPAALQVKWSGPLVAVASGDLSAEEAGALLDGVKYEASVTLSQEPKAPNSEVKKTASLLLGIVYLTGILGAAALLLGIFLGGGRAVFRVLRGKPVSTLNDDDFISLKLGGSGGPAELP